MSSLNSIDRDVKNRHPRTKTIDIIPERYLGIPIRSIVEANPVNQFVAAARESVYLVEWPSLQRWAAITAYATIVFVLGWRFFTSRSMELSEDM